MSREAARLPVQGGERLVSRRSSLQRRLLLPLHRVQLTHPAQQQIPEAGKSFVLIKKQVTQLGDSTLVLLKQLMLENTHLL